MQTAIALEDAGRFAEAAVAYQSLADAGNRAAEFNLARMHLTSGHVVAAGILFGRIVAREPENIPALHALAMARLDGGRTYEAVALLRRIVDLEPTAERWRDLCFYSLHLPGDHDALHREAAAIHPTTPAPRSTWDGVRPIRVGYICPDAPTVYPFFLPVLAAHSKKNVDAILYCDGEIHDEFCETHVCFNVKTATDEELAEMIRDDEIDVLVNLKDRRIGTMALHPAPLMYSWIGYPSWLGVDGVEPIVDQWAYRPYGIDLTPAPATVNGYITFGCVNRACKITDEVAQTWGKILVAVPDSWLKVLAVSGELNTDVRDLLVRNGVPADRLILCPQSERAGYLALINSLDIALDPWPYCGTTTTCDCLWQGVPVVTMAGNSIRHRVGERVLTQIEVTCAATTDNASSRDMMRQWRRSQMSLMGDGDRVAAALENRWMDVLQTC